MITSSNGSFFRVTGPLCGEFTSHRRIPLTNGQKCGCFFDWCPHKLLNKQSSDRWFEITRRSCDVIVMICSEDSIFKYTSSLQWRHNERGGVSNHQPRHCLLNRIFRRRSKKTSKLRVTGLCVGNSPVTGEFPAQMASNAENVSIWWRHQVMMVPRCGLTSLAAKPETAQMETGKLPSMSTLSAYTNIQERVKAPQTCQDLFTLTQWGLVTHIRVSELGQCRIVLLWSDTVAILSANARAAFNKSYPPIGKKILWQRHIAVAIQRPVAPFTNMV